MNDGYKVTFSDNERSMDTLSHEFLKKPHSRPSSDPTSAGDDHILSKFTKCNRVSGKNARAVEYLSGVEWTRFKQSSRDLLSSIQPTFHTIFIERWNPTNTLMNSI